MFNGQLTAINGEHHTKKQTVREPNSLLNGKRQCF